MAILAAIVLFLTGCKKDGPTGDDSIAFRVTLSETAITLSETGECQLRSRRPNWRNPPSMVAGICPHRENGTAC